MAALPDDVEAALLKRFRNNDADAPAGGEAAPPADDAPAAAAPNPAYGNGTRQNLDNLIENSGVGD